jgi:benzoylformate decarboxylase
MSNTLTKVQDANARRGGDVLLEVLESEGVEYIFGNPGTTELPLMDALLRRPKVSYILALQEASAVAMADGYAQASGKPGFLNLHTAGGLGHGMGALLNAACSQTPLVVTAGQQDTRHFMTDPLLLGDLCNIAKPAVKWAREVTSADQLPVLLRRAFHDADAAPKGAAFLSLPMDVMEELSTVNIGSPSNIEHKSVASSLPLLAEKLAAFAPGKVAIIAGDEISQSQAAKQVVDLAEMLAADVYGSTWPSRIPYPTAHPLWRGNLTTKATELNKALSGYDAIFALGGKSLSLSCIQKVTRCQHPVRCSNYPPILAIWGALTLVNCLLWVILRFLSMRCYLTCTKPPRIVALITCAVLMRPRQNLTLTKRIMRSWLTNNTTQL